MARFAYNDTWEIVLSDRMAKIRAGRKSYPYFKTIKFVDNFLKSLPKEKTLLDVGCGYNPFKIHYPEYNITGFDKTIEADLWGYVNDIDLKALPYENAMAINSIHFNKKEDIQERIIKIYEGLPRNGQFLFTLNDFGEDNDYPYWEKFNWESLDKVLYKYIRTNEMKNQMRRDAEKILKGDPIFQKWLLDNKDYTEEYILEKLNQVIKQDHVYGTIRVILQKTR